MNVFTEQNSLLKNLQFQYQQHRIFVIICMYLLSGILIGVLFFPKERKHHFMKKTMYTGVKDRKFIQHQILNIIRKKTPSQYTTIERVSAPTYTTFVKFIEMNRPFIITDMMKNWKSMYSWNNKYLEKKIGDVKLLVENSKDNVFYGGKNFYNMKMSDFLNLYSKKDRNTNYYVAEADINQFPGLKGDYPERLTFIPKIWQHFKTQLWIGAGNQITPMHRDEFENLLCQIKGSRNVQLYDPLQVDLLYLNPLNDAYSQVDPFNPDYSKYPLFKYARGLDVQLNPGEILYIPLNWFHHVQSNEGENLAVNYWYGADSMLFAHTHKVLSSLFWKDPYDPNGKIVKNRKQKIRDRVMEMKEIDRKKVEDFNPEKK